MLKPGISGLLKAEWAPNGFSFELSWQKDLNPIIRYHLTANEARDILIVPPQNIDFQRSIGLSFSGPVQISQWWRMILGTTTSLRKYRISYSVIPAEKSYVFQNLNFNHDL